jgi:hypothetical protein
MNASSGHPEAEGPEHEAGEDEAGDRVLGPPSCVGEAELDDAEQVEDADDQHQLVSLEQADEAVTMPGMTILSACGRMISRIMP